MVTTKRLIAEALPRGDVPTMALVNAVLAACSDLHECCCCPRRLDCLARYLALPLTPSRAEVAAFLHSFVDGVLGVG
ncbi:MAG: hypothetical protein HYX90_01100 [Chloroflexi bacterium]|nr:hypothetical protein [Chloroflexota bacterium]